MSRKTYWLKLAKFTFMASGTALAALILIVSNSWAQRFNHPKRIPVTGDALIENKIPFEDIELTTSDGIQIAAWYTPPQNGAVILVAHGYSDNRPERLHVMFAQYGYGVLSWDFRAHGMSGGEISTLGYDEQKDAEAALEYALAQPGVEHIGAWGGSMGAATMILTAAKHPEIEALVSDSSFTSLEEVFRASMPNKFFQPIVLLLGEWSSGANAGDIQPIQEIGRISPRAVFIIDGYSGAAAETNAPNRLYHAAGEPKQIWVEEGIPHLGMMKNKPKQYENKVIRFFYEYLLKK